MNFPNFTIAPTGVISKAFLDIKIITFHEACLYVQNLPYKRISTSSNLLLVLKEEQGTCSSKHGLLKQLIEENTIDTIELRIGIYKMTSQNTPGLENIIPSDVPYIPEAHAYLVSNEQRFDFTRTGSSPIKSKDILYEISVSADEMIQQKLILHTDFLGKWCVNNNFDYDRIWKIRETCIRTLSGSPS